MRLVFPEVRLTSVRIIWQPPEEPNGVILGKECGYALPGAGLMGSGWERRSFPEPGPE